mgnify:CR=1 FL=1
MCGIVGYIGSNDTLSILLNSLERLEYRGYDSAGIAFHNGKDIEIIKKAGRVSALRELTKGISSPLYGGIGHTRWATHGSVKDVNAHPHRSGRVTLVHNGIIENYKDLIKTYQIQNQLISTGDTEVAAVLLDKFYHEDPFEAIRHLSEIIQGTYAFVIMFSDRPNEIYAIRKVSPIVLVKNESEAILASDLAPLSQFSDTYYILPEKTIVKMSSDGISFRDFQGNEVDVEKEKLDWEVEQYSKQNYPFYMEKEISEQPEVLQKTIDSYCKDGLPFFKNVPDSYFQDIEEIVIVACGTSYHSGLAGKYMIEKLARIRTSVVLASEFIYSLPVLSEKTLAIGISQSGETIDTWEALKYAKSQGCRLLSVINVKGSSISQVSDYNLYTCAGPEIAVASTKAYTCQLAILYLLAGRLSLITKQKTEEEIRAFIMGLKQVPSAVKEVLQQKTTYRTIAREVLSAHDLFMIGRGLDYYTLLEGALKLKEISYIHTEAYASGELKHGPIALIEKGTPVVALMTQKDLITKESSNIKEVRARGANVIAFIKESYRSYVDMAIPIYPLPDLSDDLMLFVSITALQLFAYYVAVDKGYNVDKPRNLAKVVTVE